MTSLTFNTAAMDQVINARSILYMGQPWFGSLSLRLKLVENLGIPTMRTNGTVLQFNPDWTLALPMDQIVFTVAHEVVHCALGHPWRCGGRDIKVWNMACDYVVNGILIKAGFRPPPGALIDPQYDDMAAETVYARLMKKAREEAEKAEQEQEQDDQPGGDFPMPSEDEDEQGDEDGAQDGAGADDAAEDGESTEAEGQGEGQGEPGSDDADSNAGTGSDVTGDFEAAPAAAEGQADDDEHVMTQADWEIATQQATTVANKTGQAPGGAVAAIERARESQADWREELREFFVQTTASDYSWVRPNRRMIGSGIYLPGVLCEGMPRLGFGIDTSGSISRAQFDAVASELNGLMSELRPEALDAVYCDSAIQFTETFLPDEGPIELHIVGGGGTRFQPVLDHFAAQDEPVAAICYMSGDLENYDTELVDPGIPVLWVTSEATTKEMAFGRVIRIPE